MSWNGEGTRLRIVTPAIVIVLGCVYVWLYRTRCGGPYFWRPTAIEADVRFRSPCEEVIFAPLKWLDRNLVRPAEWSRPPCVFAPLPLVPMVKRDKPQADITTGANRVAWSNQMAIVRDCLMSQEAKIATLLLSTSGGNATSEELQSFAREAKQLRALRQIERELSDLDAERQAHVRGKESADQPPRDE